MPPSIATIQRVTADHFGVTVTDLISHRKGTAIVRPRQLAMFLSREMTGNSLPAIGRKFGNRDHSTVIHALQQIVNLRERDADLAADVLAIKGKVLKRSSAALDAALIGWAA
jgi:chromosomal replication initiator protein